MPWGKCDDGFYDHPKVRALTPRIRLAACGLYWRAISFCNRQLSDGFLTPIDVAFLDGTMTLTNELVRVGLWDQGRNGLRVHDYLTFNKGREQVLRERGLRAEAGHLGGLASGKQRRSKREPNPKQRASQLLEPPSRPSSSKNPVRSLGRTRAGEARDTAEVRSFPKNGMKPPEDEERIQRNLAILNDPAEPEWHRQAAKDDLDSLGVPVAAAR